MKIPLQKPLHPDFGDIEIYLRRIDATRLYANRGPLVREYEKRLSELFNCYVAASSSCTMGMVACLMDLYSSSIASEITLPAWTFVATANALRLAGCMPYFCDTECNINISVSHFGAAPKIWELTKMVDAAGAFDCYASFYSSSGRVPVGTSPAIISTHATKCFSTGEGGIVLSRDKDFIERVRTILNHGIDENREVHVRGLNGKMSEYHAAVGLASLDFWPETREKWRDAEKRYAKILGREPRPYVSSLYPMEINQSVVPVMAKLNEAGIGSKKVWSDGVHNFPAYKDCPRTGMEKTEWLADHTLFLPFSIDMKDEEMEYVAETLHAALG